MFRSQFISSLRSLLRQKTYSIINLLGLSIGLASAVLISSTVHEDLRWDHYTEHFDDIYRVVQIQQFGGVEAQHVSFNQLPLVPSMIRDLPEVVNGSRYHPVHSMSVFVDDQTTPVTIPHVSAVDSNFLDIFTYPVVEGDRGKLLRNPYEVVLTEDGTFPVR